MEPNVRELSIWLLYWLHMRKKDYPLLAFTDMMCRICLTTQSRLTLLRKSSALHVLHKP